MVGRALLFRALHAHFVGFYVPYFVGEVYPWPRIGLLSLGGTVWDEPAQYISMRAPETTGVVPRVTIVTPNTISIKVQGIRNDDQSLSPVTPLVS